jgi:hypothetical protein
MSNSSLSVCGDSKKRKADVAELEERLRFEGKRLQIMTQAVDLHERIASVYLSLCPNGIIDERGRMMLKDNLAYIVSR